MYASHKQPHWYVVSGSGTQVIDDPLPIVYESLPICTTMLHRISYETLRRVAIYGAALSVTGSYILYYQIQKNLASGPYYTDAIKALRADRRACTLLGEPVRFQALRLGDKENLITTEHAQVLIPVTGSKASGHLRSKATFREHHWEMDSVVLEFKGREFKLTILDRNKS